MIGELSSQAYCKAFLHAIKYQHLPVKGFFLSEVQKDGKPLIVDAIPISHDVAVFSTIFESALVILEKYCTTNGLAIAGMYFANQCLSNTKLDMCVLKIVEKLHIKYPDAYVIQLENKLFSTDDVTTCPKAYTLDTVSKMWKEKNQEFEDGDETAALIAAAVDGKLYRQISDLENLLDEPSHNDLFNNNLNKSLSSLL
uniref:MPN domain-containing protein n=1 Tax=Rhabditophanes sp. KR3021 TaxID=114890 RepID=A0AC35TQ33_9BILA